VVGPVSANELKGRPRRTLCAQVRMEEPHCWFCHLPIDLTLPRWPNPHPMSSVIHEVIPRSLHPMGPKYAALDRSNCRHAHRQCNGQWGNGTRVKRAVGVVRSRVW
jgi:hypothetical protein